MRHRGQSQCSYGLQGRATRSGYDWLHDCTDANILIITCRESLTLSRLLEGAAALIRNPWLMRATASVHGRGTAGCCKPVGLLKVSASSARSKSNIHTCTVVKPIASTPSGPTL